MSFDITIEYPPCPTCGCKPGYFEWSPTYNLGPMFEAAGLDIQWLNGRKVAVCYPIVLDALTLMRAEPKRFRAMNPSNGWGDYDEILPYLQKFVDALLAAPPEAVVRAT